MFVVQPIDIGPAHLREVNNKRVHVQAIQEAGETFTKSAETLMHKLKVHEVRFEIGHRITQFCKLWLEAIKGGHAIEAMVLRVTEG